MDSTSLAGYETALSRAAFFQQAGTGYLRLTGADRRSFIQRQSTNNLDLLQPGGLLVTVLTSPTARILDVLSLFEESPETLAILCLPGQAEATFRYLNSRIFIMDKVALEDASADFAQIDLFGPELPDVLAGLGLEQLPEPGHLAGWQLTGHTLRLFADHFLGYRLLSPAAGEGAVLAALASAGAQPLDADSYLTLRVEAGLPAAGAELTDEYTPLEAGMEWAVADGKGCYTGQEVIARQLTYEKVTQRLVGLRLESPAQPGERLMSQDEGRPAGRVTSAANSPRLGPIALAVVRRPFNQSGTRLARETGHDQATVTALPFSPLDS